MSQMHGLMFVSPQEVCSKVQRNFYIQRPLHRETFTQNSLYTRSFYTEKPLHPEAFTQSCFCTDVFTHRCFYMQTLYSQGSQKRLRRTRKLLHTEESFTQKPCHEPVFCREAFTYRSLCAEQLLHTENFIHEPLHRSFYTEKSSLRQAFTQRRIYTEKPLHTETFTQISFYTKKPLHTEDCTHTSIYTEKALHTHREPFTHKGFYTETFAHTKKHLHIAAFTESSFYTQKLTRRCFCKHKLLHRETFT